MDNKEFKEKYADDPGLHKHDILKEMDGISPSRAKLTLEQTFNTPKEAAHSKEFTWKDWVYIGVGIGISAGVCYLIYRFSN